MGDNDTTSTRRETLKYGGAVAAGLGLAGCSNVADQSATPTGTGAYSATIEPMGTVEFNSVPETWLAMTAGWADMGIALGQDPPAGLTTTSRYHTHHYEDIPGVSVDRSDILQLYDAGIDKELFYEQNVDLHVFDPNFLINRVENLGRADIDEIAEKVAPFFGNTVFSRNYGWHDGYRYYTMYEAFEKLADVFQEQARYEAFASLHDAVQTGLQNRLPPVDDRPSVATVMVVSEEPEVFYPFRIEQGTGWKQWRDLGVRDAFEESDVETFTAARGSIGYEKLLDVDPDYLLLYGYESLSATEFQQTFLSFFEDHDVASELTAVQNGHVHRAGGFYQGPIINLSLTERAANQLYPDEFGGEQLYDRERIADIVTGAVDR